MTAIGSRNHLRILREAPPGLYLDGETLGEILLPRRYVTPHTTIGAIVEVFVYRDSEDRLVATTETPRAMVGDFAFLKVVSADRQRGAFLDWGLSKDLLLPRREQAQPVTAGQGVVVYVFLDLRQARIVATTHLERHLNETAPFYAEGQRVELLITAQTALGYKAIVENAHAGLLYQSELSTALEIGQRCAGFVRQVRSDGKLDLGLDPAGYRRVAPLTQQIVAVLRAHGGRLECDDDSPPETIRATFQTSKKAFKQALGALYRERVIRFTKPGIQLVAKTSRPAR